MQVSRERTVRLDEQLRAADKQEQALQLQLTDSEHKLYVCQLEQQTASKTLAATRTTVDNLKDQLREARAQISQSLSAAGRDKDALVAATSLSASLSADVAALRVSFVPDVLMICRLC
jgi:predicted  nucleic acid-binding Zn-ribbon protein